MFRRQTPRTEIWAIAAGAAAGAGALAFAVARGVRMLRRRRERSHDEYPAMPAELEALEDAAVELLRRDRHTGVCAIDVAAVGPGIIELTGLAPTHEVSQRAARVLHALPGVRTVISRLDVGTAEERLAASRIRHATGAPETSDRRWYGVRVGTGRRRQSPDTDPDRTDDSVHRITRQLEVRSDDHGIDDSTGPAAGNADAVQRPM
jgi:hypothetical protein